MVLHDLDAPMGFDYSVPNFHFCDAGYMDNIWTNLRSLVCKYPVRQASAYCGLKF